MALVAPPDRVWETSTTTGTGALSLLGPESNFRGFVAAVGSGNSVDVAIIHRTLPEWEVVRITVTDGSPDTITRANPPISSSNGGSPVNFSAGVKDIYTDLSGPKVAFLDLINTFTTLQRFQYGDHTARFGADSGLATLTDATTKATRLEIPHYTNAEEPAAILFGQSSSADNVLNFGGGTASCNAATKIRFYTGATITTTTGTVTLVIDNQNIGIGTESWGSSAAKVLGVANGTAPTTSPANMVQVWAEDVSASSELRVRDEAGNVTTLSPHSGDVLDSMSDDSPLPWVYRSHNDYLGYEVIADMAGVIAAVEALTGKTFATYRPIPCRDWDADQQAQANKRQREIDQATQAQADALQRARLESDEAAQRARRQDAEVISIPKPYTKKPLPTWMARRLAGRK